MLAIRNRALIGLRNAQSCALASRIHVMIPGLGTLEVVQRYVDEAVEAGIETEQDIAEFALLLAPLDKIGRPEAVQRLIADRAVSGPLKVFQIHFALHGERS